MKPSKVILFAARARRAGIPVSILTEWNREIVGEVGYVCPEWFRVGRWKIMADAVQKIGYDFEDPGVAARLLG